MSDDLIKRARERAKSAALVMEHCPYSRFALNDLPTILDRLEKAETELKAAVDDHAKDREEWLQAQQLLAAALRTKGNE